MRRLASLLALFGIPFVFSTQVHGQSEMNVAQHVRPVDGVFRAKVVVPMPNSGATIVPNATVKLLGKDGTRYEARTDMQGDAVIKDVKPGLYAMTTYANGLFACYAMHVIGTDSYSSTEFPSQTDISCALVAPSQFGSVVMPYVASTVDRDSDEFNPATLVSRITPASSKNIQVARTGKSLKGVVRSADSQVAKQMNVFLFKNRIRIDRTISDQAGRFQFKNLPVGIYSLVTVGPQGLAAVGFELVDQPSPRSASLTSDGTTLVVQDEETAESSSLGVDVGPLTSEDLEEILDNAEEDEEDEDDSESSNLDESLADDGTFMDEFGNPVDPTTPAGAPGAGGGGSGGGGGGSGGAGGIGAAGGAAGIAAAAAGSGSGGGAFGGFNPPITSPVIPVPAPVPVP